MAVMDGVKAIETQYKGFRFRSRLEARYAVWLDALRVDWRYEQEGYDLNGEWYLPDFWLPMTQCFLEVKPRPPGLNSRDCRCCRLLAKQTERPVWMAFDPQLRTEDWQAVFRINAAYWDRDGNHRERPLFELMSPNVEPYDGAFEELADYMERKREADAAFNITHGIDKSGNWLVNAFRAFRSARFEFGESGAP